MRRTLLILISLLSIVLVSGFTSLPQSNSTQITILDRAGQPTSQITDGDSIQIQITMSQPVAGGENIKFGFDT